MKRWSGVLSRILSAAALVRGIAAVLVFLLACIGVLHFSGRAGPCSPTASANTQSVSSPPHSSHSSALTGSSPLEGPPQLHSETQTPPDSEPPTKQDVLQQSPKAVRVEDSKPQSHTSAPAQSNNTPLGRAHKVAQRPAESQKEKPAVADSEKTRALTAIEEKFVEACVQRFQQEPGVNEAETKALRESLAKAVAQYFDPPMSEDEASRLLEAWDEYLSWVQLNEPGAPGHRNPHEAIGMIVATIPWQIQGIAANRGHPTQEEEDEIHHQLQRLLKDLAEEVQHRWSVFTPAAVQMACHELKRRLEMIRRNPWIPALKRPFNQKQWAKLMMWVDSGLQSQEWHFKAIKPGQMSDEQLARRLWGAFSSVLMGVVIAQAPKMTPGQGVWIGDRECGIGLGKARPIGGP